MGWYSPESAGAAVVRSVLGLPKHALSCHVMALLLGLEAVWSELVDLELDASPRAAELLALITGQVSTAESVLPCVHCARTVLPIAPWLYCAARETRRVFGTRSQGGHQVCAAGAGRQDRSADH